MKLGRDWREKGCNTACRLPMYIFTTLLCSIVFYSQLCDSVLTGKSINPPIGSKYVLAGGTIDLECWSDKPNDDFLKWSLNGTSLFTSDPNDKSGPPLEILSTRGYRDRTLLHLIWRRVTLTQTGRYRCKDLKGDSYYREVSVIQIKPTINKTDDKITLGCQVRGIPEHMYQAMEWYHGKHQIWVGEENEDKYDMNDMKNIMMIYDAKPSDRGQYTCVLKTIGTKMETFNQTVSLDPYINAGATGIQYTVNTAIMTSLAVILQMCIYK